MAAVAALSSMNPLQPAMPPATERRTDLPRPYKCPLCDKAFHRLEHQTRHIRTHTGEKPHACQFAGCAKRFSRSDELTRHSRIHTNPNSRKGNKANVTASSAAAAAVVAAAAAAAAFDPSSTPTTFGSINLLPPPATRSGPRMMSRSAPGSQLSSPNASPPHSYARPGLVQPGYAPPRSTVSSAGNSPNELRQPLDINISLLASAADQVEREQKPAFFFSAASLGAQTSDPLSLPGRLSQRPLSHHQFMHAPFTNSQLLPPAFTQQHQQQHQQQYSHIGHHRQMPSVSSTTSSQADRLPGLDQYSMSSLPVSRSHSHENLETFAQRAVKRSRPSSPPSSTAPPSPSFSHDSYSPTPEHTPLATPSHSPRMRQQAVPRSSSPTPGPSLPDLQLPHLRHLSIAQAPALAPMEPTTAVDAGPFGVGISSNSTGSTPVSPPIILRIADIVDPAKSADRLLPLPSTSKMSVHDLLNNSPASRTLNCPPQPATLYHEMDRS